jgi:hypothetical protein
MEGMATGIELSSRLAWYVDAVAAAPGEVERHARWRS